MKVMLEDGIDMMKTNKDDISIIKDYDKPNTGNKRKANCRSEYLRNHHNVAVIGSGMTAAHKILELLSKMKDENYPNRTIHLVSIHPIKEKQFDTHQDWMMDRAGSERSIQGGGYGFSNRQLMFQNCSCYQEY